MNFAKENQILKADEALTKLLMRSEEIEYNTFKKLSLELEGCREKATK